MCIANHKDCAEVKFEVLEVGTFSTSHSRKCNLALVRLVDSVTIHCVMSFIPIVARKMYSCTLYNQEPAGNNENLERGEFCRMA